MEKSLSSTHNNHSSIDQLKLEDEPNDVRKLHNMGLHKIDYSSGEKHTTPRHNLLAKQPAISFGESENLLKDKLLKPIDQSFMIENGVTIESLSSAAMCLTEEDPRIQHLVECYRDATALYEQLASLPLSPQMAFKLTVAKQQKPELFHHLLLATIISQYLAVMGDFPKRELNNLLCAALFHDLGELHTDPTVLNSKHELSNDEWHHIYAHPITGYLIVREAADLEPSVSMAILHHQERLDGSGYPSGLRGSQIGPFARIVGVADVCASVLVKGGSNERLINLMRLNCQKYDPKLLALLNKGFGHFSVEDAVESTTAIPQLKAVAELLEKWRGISIALSANELDNPQGKLKFLFDRMDNLHSVLLQFGFDPERLHQLFELAATDPVVARELSEVLSEVDWHFKDLERETVRWEEINRHSLNIDDNQLILDWNKELHAYLHRVH